MPSLSASLLTYCFMKPEIQENSKEYLSLLLVQSSKYLAQLVYSVMFKSMIWIYCYWMWEFDLQN